MTKQEETNMLLNEINNLILKGEMKNDLQIIGAVLIDIAKSLSIIADSMQELASKVGKNNEQMDS